MLRWATITLGLATIRKVLAELSRSEILALPVKGIVLSHLLYVDPTDREMCDVDLLVPPRDFFRCLRVARANRWKVVWDSKALGSVNFVVDGMPVDLRCSLGAPGQCAVGAAEVIARAREAVSPLGFPHRHIELHDHALLLAIDAFKDKFITLRKPAMGQDLLGIAGLPEFDVDRFVARARAARLETLLFLVASWLTALPPHVPTGPSLVEKAIAGWNEILRQTDAALSRHRFVATYQALAGKPSRSRFDSLLFAVLARAASDSPVRRIGALVLGAVGTGAFVLRHRRVSANPWEDAGRQT